MPDPIFGFFAITADYPERGGHSIPKYLSLTPFTWEGDNFLP